MRTLFLIIASSLFLACGKHDKKNNTPHPGPSNPTAPSVEPDPYNLVEREAGVVQKYKAIGVTFEFWSGQDANLRDIEINQLQQLLPHPNLSFQALLLSIINGVTASHWSLRHFDHLHSAV